MTVQRQTAGDGQRRPVHVGQVNIGAQHIAAGSHGLQPCTVGDDGGGAVSLRNRYGQTALHEHGRPALYIGNKALIIDRRQRLFGVVIQPRRARRQKGQTDIRKKIIRAAAGGIGSANRRGQRQQKGKTKQQGQRFSLHGGYLTSIDAGIGESRQNTHSFTNVTIA